MPLPETLTEYLPATPHDLFNLLASLQISYKKYDHPAFFTVADGLEFEKNIQGLHCRNLFLRDKSEKMFLVSAANDTKIDLKKLGPALGAGRFSFGSPERLMRHLGVAPGSVCPFAVINDHGGVVQPVLDATIMAADIVNFHPLLNTMTIGMTPQDLVVIMRHLKHPPLILDMTPLAPEEIKS